MRHKGGWLHVICGPMFSGKTDELLRLTRRLAITGYDIAVFKPALDTRTETVASRSGVTYEARAVDGAQGIVNHGWNSDVIVIDEAQFFDDELVDAILLLLQRGKHIIAAGLDRDFRGWGFGPMPEMLVIADEVTKLTAVCFKCKGEASLTQRLINGEPSTTGETVELGGMGDEKYEARCRGCWEHSRSRIGPAHIESDSI